MRAVISVSDKSGLGEFARALVGLRVEIYSTGGHSEGHSGGGRPG